MFHKIIFAVSLIAAATLTADELISEWDFSTGKIADKSGKYQMRFRGKTKLEGADGKKTLVPGISEPSKPEGIESIKIYPELTPTGAFRIECKFELRERTSKEKSLYFWDNMYCTDDKSNLGNPLFHSGFMLYFYEIKADHFCPAVRLGFGGKGISLWGKSVKIEPEKIHTFAFQYDGKTKFKFMLDGKLLSEGMLKEGGPLSPARYPVVIGDRYNATFGHLDGKIYNIKLFKVTEVK